MDYMTANEAAEKWGVTRRWVLKYCLCKRIAGATKKGNLWLIPNGTVKPADLRRKTDVLNRKTAL